MQHRVAPPADRTPETHVLHAVLAALVLSLTPLAHATPPDQTCIAGLYDDADYDDAIVAVTGMIASLDGEASHHPRQGDLIIGLVVLRGETVPSTRLVSSSSTRAPPDVDPPSRSV
jgi:hypothetical protein